MPSLLQRDTIYASVKDEGGSLGTRVENSPFLNAVCLRHSWCWDLSLSTCYCLRAKNASVLYPSADDSAPIFGTNANSIQVAQRVHGLHHVRRPWAPLLVEHEHLQRVHYNDNHRFSSHWHCRRQASTTAERHNPILPVGIDTKFKPCNSLSFHQLSRDFELFRLCRS